MPLISPVGLGLADVARIDPLTGLTIASLGQSPEIPSTVADGTQTVQGGLFVARTVFRAAGLLALSPGGIVQVSPTPRAWEIYLPHAYWTVGKLPNGSTYSANINATLRTIDALAGIVNWMTGLTMIYDTVPASTHRIHGAASANEFPVAPARVYTSVGTRNPLAGRPLELFGTTGAVAGGDPGDIVALYVSYNVLADPNP